MKEITFELTDNQFDVLELERGGAIEDIKNLAVNKANRSLNVLFKRSVDAAFNDSSKETITTDRDAIITEALALRKTEAIEAAAKQAAAAEAVANEATRVAAEAELEADRIH